MVYCKDTNRKREVSRSITFDFLGYTFRPRRAKWRGENCTGCLFSRQPAREGPEGNSQGLSGAGHSRPGATRNWTTSRGCSTRTSGAGSTTTVTSTSRRCIQPASDRFLSEEWARRKFERFKQRPKGAREWLARIITINPALFAHWKLLYARAGHWEPDELRGSRTVLRERGGEIPPRDSTRQRTLHSQGAVPCDYTNTSRRPKRPRDPAQLAKLVVDIAAGAARDAPQDWDRGRRGGPHGHPAGAAGFSDRLLRRAPPPLKAGN